MTRRIDRVLEHDLAALAVPGLLLGHRLISPGDEDALLDAEAVSITATTTLLPVATRCTSPRRNLSTMYWLGSGARERAARLVSSAAAGSVVSCVVR